MTSATWREAGPLRRTMSGCCSRTGRCDSECGLGTSSISIPWDLLEMQNLRHHLPHHQLLLNQTLHFTGLPSDFCAHQCLRSAALMKKSFSFLRFDVWTFVILGCSLSLDPRTAFNPRITTTEVLLLDPF